MRTLVVGIPLPHVSFDNYSFISAPSLSDYGRLIVQVEAVSKVVDEVIAGSAQHRNFAGQPVANQQTTATSFALSALLAMRRREAVWLLKRGGLLVCFAYPDVAHAGIDTVAEWRRYSWLPHPRGSSYEHLLLPGFGTSGAALVEEDHPFASYVTSFGTRLGYRTVIDEAIPNFSDYGRVFARSAGGAAIGAELRVDEGHVILLPPLAPPDTDRALLAQTLFDCMERWRELTANGQKLTAR